MKFINSRTGLVGAALAVVMLAGGSTAAVAHGYGPSIGGEDIRNESISSQDIRNGQVKTGEIQNKSITLHDVHPNLVEYLQTGEKGDKGAAGADGADGTNGTDGVDGAPGADGDDGADGADGVSGYEVVGRTADAKSDTGQVTLVSPCADGDVVLSGGVKADNPSALTIHSSFPSDITEVQPPSDEEPSGVWAATSWTTVYTNAGEQSVQPFLVCADTL